MGGSVRPSQLLWECVATRKNPSHKSTLELRGGPRKWKSQETVRSCRIDSLRRRQPSKGEPPTVAHLKFGPAQSNRIDKKTFKGKKKYERKW